MTFLFFHGILCDKHNNSRGKNLIIHVVQLKQAFENYFTLLCHELQMIREFSMFEGAVTWKESTAIKAKDRLPKKKLKKSWTGKVASTAPIPIKCLCASFSNPKTQEVKITHLTVSWASVIYNCTRKYMYFYSVWGEISLHHELSFLDEYKTD